MKMATRGGLVVGALIAALATGCDDKTKSTPTATSASAPVAVASSAPPAASSSAPPATLTAEAFCARVFGAVVSDATKACSDDDKKTEAYKLLASFADDPLEECTSTVVDAVKAKRLVFDGEVATKCAAAAEKSRKPAPGGHLGVPDLDEVPECATLVKGTQPRGEPCATTLECQEGLSCQSQREKERRCWPIPTKADDACDAVTLSVHDFGHRPRCGQGLVCDPVSDHCKAPVAEGGACGDSAQCAEGLGCYASKCSSKGPGDVGDACDDDTDDCKPGLFCDNGTAKAGKCAAKKAAGAPCADSIECKGQCTSGKCAAFCGSG